MSEIRCPECDGLLTKKDKEQDKCSKCGFYPIQQWMESEQKTEQEELLRKNRTLTEKYSILRKFQLVITLSIFIYSFYFIINLGDIFDSGLLYGDNLKIVIIPFLLFLFNSVCVILMVNFLFELNERISNNKWH